MRKDFTPLVYSVDGITGHEARDAEKRLATHLAAKWKKGYPEMVHMFEYGWHWLWLGLTAFSSRVAAIGRGLVALSLPMGLLC